MAPRHASITRVPNGTWELTDLGSPEGTFLRVTSATLRRGSTFLIGSTKLLFTPAADESDEVDAAHGSTTFRRLENVFLSKDNSTFLEMAILPALFEYQMPM